MLEEPNINLLTVLKAISEDKIDLRGHLEAIFGRVRGNQESIK